MNTFVPSDIMIQNGQSVYSVPQKQNYKGDVKLEKDYFDVIVYGYINIFAHA